MIFVLFLTLNSIISFVMTNVICDASTILIEKCRFSVLALSWEKKIRESVRICRREVPKSVK